MWYSHKFYKKATEVTTRLKALTYKKDKLDTMKYNIQIRVIAFGWEEFKTQWLKDGRQKSIPELERRLEQIIEKTRGRKTPPRPKVPILERTDMGILGQINHQVKAMGEKAAYKPSDFDKVSKEKWKSNEQKGIGSMHQLLQNPDPPKVDEFLLGSRIEYLSEFELYDERGEGGNKYLRWCGGIMEKVCDETWINPGNRIQCYK